MASTAVSIPINLSPNTLRLLHPAYSGFMWTMYAWYPELSRNAMNAFWENYMIIGRMSVPNDGAMCEFYSEKERRGCLTEFPGNVSVSWKGEDKQQYSLIHNVQTTDRGCTYRVELNVGGVNILNTASKSVHEMIKDKYGPSATYWPVENGEGTEDAVHYYW